MYKKIKSILIPVLSTVFVFSLLIYLTFTNLDKVGNLLKIKNLGTKTIERIIDNNSNFWTEYRGQNFSFKFPMYLSPFNDISATELTEADELVANYRRNSDSEFGDSSTGRSYSLILMQKDRYFKTQNLDVKDWIIENKLNIQNRDCTTCSDQPELPIEETTLGGRKAYSISVKDEKTGVSRTQIIYFQTPSGIASIGFFSYTSSKYLINDYNVFMRTIESFTFSK